jgi:hypothetical protein
VKELILMIITQEKMLCLIDLNAHHFSDRRETGATPQGGFQNV